MTKDEALKLALEALDIVKIHFTQNRHVNEAITAIKEALAQPEQEPFAFFHPHKGFYFAKPTSVSAPTIVDFEPLALYTTPPQRTWVGLSDDEYTQLWGMKPDLLNFFRKIEAKLKEKNT